MSAETYLFVSDLHLDASVPAAADQFLAFLEDRARHASGLYILGDLFEAWVGDDDTEPLRSRVCAALKSATARGLPCHVVRGNRDFLFGPEFERRTGCRLLPDPVRVTIGGRPIFVAHGDLLCTDDSAYQELRSIVRTAAWQRRFMAMPLALRRAMAGAARAGSRAHTARTRLSIMDVNETVVRRAFEATGTTLMIHGHTHRPGIHVHATDAGPATRIVLGDWYDQGSCLRYDADGTYELEALPRPG